MRRGNPILRVAGVAYRPSVTVIRSVVTLLALASCAAMTTAAGAKTSICGGTRVPIDTSVLGTPFTNLTLGGNDGSFLIDTGATYSLVDMRRYGLPEDTKIFLSGFSLPLVQSGTFVAVDLSLFAAPLGGQLGTVGTDFLSLHSLEFHYEPSQPFAALGSEACNPATLHRAGFVAVGLPGYYATDLSRLKNGMPNVPVIGLHWSSHIPHPSGHRLRRLPQRSYPSQRCLDEDSPRKRNTNAPRPIRRRHRGMFWELRL